MGSLYYWGVRWVEAVSKVPLYNIPFPCLLVVLFLLCCPLLLPCRKVSRQTKSQLSVACFCLSQRTYCADNPDLVSPSADLLLCGHHATRSSLHSHSAVKDSHCFSFTSTISTTLERLDIRILWLLCIIHPRSPTYSSISTPAATHSADVPDVFNSPHLTARVCRVSSSSHPN